MGRRERGKREREEYTNRLHWGLGNRREKPGRAGRKEEKNLKSDGRPFKGKTHTGKAGLTQSYKVNVTLFSSLSSLPPTSNTVPQRERNIHTHP